MAALFLLSTSLTNGALTSHSSTPSNSSPPFLFSPARPALNLSSVSSSFFSGELQLCRNPSSGPIFSRRKSGGFTAKARDFYESLNLNRNATNKEIKSSYRNLARKYHPDMNKSPGAEEKFKEIGAAYEVLSDEDKRSLYDQYGEAGVQGDYTGADTGSEGIDPFEVFNTFFGQSNGLFGEEIDSMGINFNSRFKQDMGLDIRYDLSLSFEESICGGQREINIVRYETCDNCSGSGAKSSTSIKTCSQCGGRGRIMKTKRTQFGVVSQVSSCLSCGGKGKIITDNCKMCNGEGKLQIKRCVKIDVPAGVGDGFTIQIQGQGSSDRKRGIVGDLYLFVHINEKPGIRREGLNLYSDINIDYTDAILGTTIKVETVEGNRDLCIPPGTQPGEVIKFSNMGVPNVKKPSVRGDHHFIVRIQIPKNISEDERSLLKQLASIRNTVCDSSIPREGAFQWDSNKQKRTDQPSHASRRRRRASDHSLWGSIKNLFGGKKRGSSFASIAIHSVAPTCSVVRVTPIFTFPVGVFLVTLIISMVGRKLCSLVLRKRHRMNSTERRNE